MSYQKQWGFLKRNFEGGNLAHAFLFSGQDIASIKNFTREFIKEINLAMPQADRMIDLGIFPDLLVVKSSDSPSSIKNEKDMMEISIEQVRDAQGFLSLKSYYGGFKSVIIENAERMTKEAQNCFLKTLEEPSGKTIIFLITSKPDFLLPTIFSRCQQFKFFKRGSEDILSEDKKFFEDITRVIKMDLAEKFAYSKNINLEGDNFSKILRNLEKYFRQRLLAKIGLPKYGGGNHTLEKLKKILKLIESLSYQSSMYNINQKMALEILLLEL